MSTQALCPFSKPIIGEWCQCPHAEIAERCSGKMSCSQAESYLESCASLAELLKQQFRFVLGLNKQDTDLTHAQSMKIRCGGLLGMQRVLRLQPGVPPAVREVIAGAEQRYGRMENFPFNELVQDIQVFRHRKKTSRRG